MSQILEAKKVLTTITTTTTEMLPCTASFVDVLLFKPPEFTPYDFPADIIRLRTSNGNQIYATFLQRRDAKITILYSHGNAEDLNTCYWYLRKLSRKLKVNVLAYDYSGYGKSTGQASEDNCYADIDAAYEYLIRKQRFRPEQIVVYGRSLGSGPSCYLASKSALDGRSVGGLVLHSPFTSVYRIVMDLGFTLVGDRFPNIDRMQNIRCKVLIVHGDQDEVVPFKHGVALHDALPKRCKSTPFWVEGMKHNSDSAETEDALILQLFAFLENQVMPRLLTPKKRPTSSRSSRSRRQAV